MKKILAFSGSNSSKSINQQFVGFAAAMVTQAEVEVISLRDFTAPIYSMDEEAANGIPATMLALAEKIVAADGVIISSPEHNSMMPAVFKNTMDWMSRSDLKQWKGKPVLLFSASAGGRGGITNLTNMANIMPHWGAIIVATHAQARYLDQVHDGVLVPEVAAVVLEKVQLLEAALA